MNTCDRIAEVFNILPTSLYDDYLKFVSGNYGLEIKKIRQATGKTKKDFAGIIGVGRRTVEKWEINRTGLQETTLKNLKK